MSQRTSRHGNNNLQSLANEAQFLILNKSSGQELYDKVSENLEVDQKVDWILEQFRGNLIVDGCQPGEESEWTQIQIGSDLTLEILGT